MDTAVWRWLTEQQRLFNWLTQHPGSLHLVGSRIRPSTDCCRTCCAWRYSVRMSQSIRHKGVERSFKSGSRAGIQAAHAPRLARQLSALDAATRPEDMNRPGWDWHPLKGSLFGHWSVSVNGNWRLTFAFENGDAILVDDQDYH